MSKVFSFSPSHSRLVAKNAAALYAVQIAGYVAPLITLPLLARVLGAEEYGRVAFAQSFALWMSLMIEYGFNLSATRDIAKLRADREALARLVASVLGAKGVLVLVTLGLCGAALLLVSAFRERPVYLAGAWLLSVANGMTPNWYFQGIERLAPAAAVNVFCRFLGVACLFVAIRGPFDGWKVLFIYAATAFLAHGINYAMLYREVEFRVPGAGDIVQGLRDGLGVFIMQLPGSILSVGNTFLLGLLAGPVAVAYYSGADRLIRPVLSLLWPLTVALLPHISSILQVRPDVARRAVVGSLVSTTVAAATGAFVLFFAAPYAVTAFLGPEYEISANVFRVLVLLLPITAAINVVGYQWLVPLGYERILARVYMAAMLVNLSAAALLVPRLGVMGMACSVVAAESTVLLGAIAWARRLRRG